MLTTQIKFTYLNHNGKTAERTIDFECLEFVREPGFGYQSGWFVSGFCHDKQARRSFALSRIILTPNEPESAPPKQFVLVAL